MKFCPYCGSPVTDEGKRCGHCGCNLEAEDPLDAADFSEWTDAPTVRVSRVTDPAPSEDEEVTLDAPKTVKPAAAEPPAPLSVSRLMGSMGGVSFGGVSAPTAASDEAEEPAREEPLPAEFESGEPEPLPPVAEEALPEAVAEPTLPESEPLRSAADQAVPEAPPAAESAEPAPAKEPPRTHGSRLMGRMGDHSYDFPVDPEESSPSLGPDTARRVSSRVMGKVGSVRYVNVTPIEEVPGSPADGGFVPPRGPGRTSGAGSVPPRTHRRWPWIAVGCTALALVLAFAGFFVWQRHLRSVIRDSMESLRVYAESFEDSDGYVAEDRAEEAISAVYRRAMTLPGVSFAQKDEYGVYIDVKSGLDYVYMPEIRDRDSGGSSLNIITLQPYCTENRQLNLDRGWNYDLDAPDACARETGAADSRWSFRPADDVNDSFVSMERILHLDDYKMILWQGHGGYSRGSGYYLCTAIKADDALLRKYRGVTPETAVITLDGTLGLKPEFFRENFGDNAFDNAFLYFGTCYSGKTDAFARVFTEKGAAVVFVNSEFINRGYNLDMMRLIVEAFCLGPDSPAVQTALAGLGSHASFNTAGNWTVADCLTLAQQYYGATDPNVVFFPAKVSYRGSKADSLTYKSWMAGFPDAVAAPEAEQPAPEVSATVTTAEPESTPAREKTPPPAPASSSDTLANGEYFGLLTFWTADSMTVEMLDYAGIFQESLNYDLRPTGRMLTLPVAGDADVYLEWAWASGEEIHCSSIDDALNTRIWDDTAVLREQCTMQIQFTVNKGVVTSIMFLYAA